VKNTTSSQNRTGSKQKAMRSYLKILRDKEASKHGHSYLVQNNSIGTGNSQICSKRQERTRSKNSNLVINQHGYQRAKTPLSVINPDNSHNKRSLSKSKLGNYDL
jgi:hypothetical protein